MAGLGRIEKALKSVATNVGRFLQDSEDSAAPGTHDPEEMKEGLLKELSRKTLPELKTLQQTTREHLNRMEDVKSFLQKSAVIPKCVAECLEHVIQEKERAEKEKSEKRQKALAEAVKQANALMQLAALTQLTDSPFVTAVPSMYKSYQEAIKRLEEAGGEEDGRSKTELDQHAKQVLAWAGIGGSLPKAGKDTAKSGNPTAIATSAPKDALPTVFVEILDDVKDDGSRSQRRKRLDPVPSDDDEPAAKSAAKPAAKPAAKSAAKPAKPAEESEEESDDESDDESDGESGDESGDESEEESDTIESPRVKTPAKPSSAEPPSEKRKNANKSSPAEPPSKRQRTERKVERHMCNDPVVRDENAPTTGWNAFIYCWLTALFYMFMDKNQKKAASKFFCKDTISRICELKFDTEFSKNQVWGKARLCAMSVLKRPGFYLEHMDDEPHIKPYLNPRYKVRVSDLDLVLGIFIRALLGPEAKFGQGTVPKDRLAFYTEVLGGYAQAEQKRFTKPAPKKEDSHGIV